MKHLSTHYSIFILFFICIQVSYSQPVITNGLLKVSGNKIVNKDNKAVSFAGNSFFWSNDGWGGEFFYNAEAVKWLKNDWGTTIIRAAMGVEDAGGYIDQPANNKTKVKKLVEAAIAEDLYVIIDWHSHYAHLNTDKAISFFQEMAQLYGKYDNIIYEIYNEPKYIDATPANDGKFAKWSTEIKPYAEKVIAAIRAIDPDNLILVGTGEWSQKVDDAANSPLSDANVAYVLHFYSINHKQWLRDRASAALNKGIALFASEWGPVGNSTIDAESDAWMKWCKDNNISHCAWAVNSKDEPWSIVTTTASKTGGWSDADLRPAGLYEKNIIKNWNVTPDGGTAVLQTKAAPFGIYPTIVSETLFIKGLSGNIDFSIYNVTGFKIASCKGNTFDAQNLKAGIYFIKVGNQVERFVKQ